ncbi:MAG: PIN domain-containing protein, partial [Phycicoccus sp.]
MRGWWNGRPVALAGHALAETYSALTRLPADLWLTPEDAARLLSARFTRPLQLGARTFRRLPLILSGCGVTGGAVYDALVALAAVEHGCPLATRDGRAQPTYEAIGAQVLVVG